MSPYRQICMYMCIHARNNETEAYSSDKIMPMLATTSRSGRGSHDLSAESIAYRYLFFFSKATIRRNGGQDNT